MSDEVEDIDTRIQTLESQIREARERNYFETSIRLCHQMKRLAKLENRIIPYLLANFYLMNDSRSLFDPQTGKEAAIENIALLESEDLARKFQNDFPEYEYQHTVGWMSTCNYDNLATNVAEIEGYNSDGIHACIADGLQVCRRTGKLDCISCFREYAGDVYRASDDLDMAIHYAQTCKSQPAREGGQDRRWIGARDLSDLLTLNGQLNDAIELLVEALSYVDDYHSPRSARLTVNNRLETLLWLAGRESEWPKLRLLVDGEAPLEPPPAAEDRHSDLQNAFRDAVIATCQRDYSSAIAILTPMDKLLQSRKNLALWFEVRLRLIAVYLMAGDVQQAEGLGKPLHTKATAARDWLTLRRLKQLLSGEVPPSPHAAVAACKEGPFAILGSPHPQAIEPGQQGGLEETLGTASQSKEAADAEGMDSTTPESAVPPEQVELSPFAAMVAEIQQSCMGVEEDAQYQAIFESILQIDSSMPAKEDDPGLLLFLASVIGGQVGRNSDAWRWAQPFMERYSQNAIVKNIAATIAWGARNEADEAEAEAETMPSVEQIEKWYRASLDLDPENCSNHSRAGNFYVSIGREGDAERCWARGFRLQRSNPYVALRLARIYDESDRRSDGLAVLDMCIREGGEDPSLFWEAGISALVLERWESVITYFNRFEELASSPWADYYRAMALVELKRPEEALRFLQRAADENPEQLFGVKVLQAVACSQLDQVSEARNRIAEVLKIPLFQVDYMTYAGIQKLFEKLFLMVREFPREDELRNQVESLGYQAGVVPEDYFAILRKEQPIVSDLKFFTVELLQMLGEGWATFAGRLAGQDNWIGYKTLWGVLALDQESAIELATLHQDKCYPQEGVVTDVTMHSEGFVDSPGITWQGMRVEMD